MSEKMGANRSSIIALGIICIVLIGGLGGAMLYTITLLNDKNNQIDSLNIQISTLNSTISSLDSQISQLDSIVSSLQNQSEPYIHSQLLENEPPTPISANNNTSGWILEWTPTTDVRIVKIGVWMGNPDNVVWEGDTYVTIGKPSDPSNPSSYNDAIQLLVHYQFDSHAPSPIPHQLMFDLTPGFKVTSGQTINVYRLFVNTEPYSVNAGDVQVIIYYENA